ncbi:calcium/sodium antiporter [Palleronia sp. KMU-117]|uniref:calcium/sodium antiporter n=1 Tax=Palleronia sp. KMU-117 TaxID=3434108 RepID=UPI003D70BADD
MTALFFALGLGALFLGGSWLVRGAVAIALAFRIPAFVVGATVVGFGTSTPELLVSVQAALAGVPAVAIGNVVGSNTANILLILGLTALFGAIAAPWRALRPDMLWMLAAALATVPAMIDGQVTRLDGALLAAALVVYLVLSLRRGGDDALELPVQDPIWRAALFVVIGLALLMIGARFLVDSATTFARAFGVSEAVIGLTIVAVGTSLPELAASVASAIKGQRDMALGNIVGSNIFNILAILGITALITPIPVEGRFLQIDIPVMVATTLALLGLSLWRGAVTRAGGIGLLAGYGAYLGLLGTGL